MGGWGCTVTFDPAGGVATASSKSVVYGQKYGELPSATKTGYTFVGWFTEKEEGKGEKVTENDTVTKGFDYTLYAHWTANNYTVTLNVSGGDALPVNEFTVTYGKPYNCLPSASRAGHTFIGWFTEESGGIEVTNKTSASIVADNHTLYAQWTENNYTVTLNANGGDALPVNEFTVTYGQPYNCLPNASRTGYTFTGWFTEENGGIEITNMTTANITADNHTLYAQWTINNYTLTFDYGNGTADNKTLKYNETIVYPENLTREGCAFSGWKPKPERMPANDTTVVAQWIENATSEVIKIVFSKKDMTKDEVSEIIKGFTKENFIIKEFEVNENGNFFVIIRFDDTASAKNFVEAITDNGNSNDLFIESISFLSEPLQDMATGLQLPSSIFGLFFLFPLV